jgi:hypothetical protein
VWDGEDGLDGEKWDRLKEFLSRDAVGSKIVVTTRSHLSDSDINLYDKMLQSLQPNLNLQELEVVGYRGMRFPSWLSNLSNLVRIHLENCTRPEHIPPLDGIPSLEDLLLTDMESLEYIDSEGVGGRGVFFPSLRELRIFYCPRLKGWWKKSRDESTVEEGLRMLCFPRLSSLKIRREN